MSDDLQWPNSAQLEVVSQTTGGRQREINRKVQVHSNLWIFRPDDLKPQATNSHLTP